MTYRNRALLDLCHQAPCLLLPGQHECLGLRGGLSEPCHSDMIRHGRGHHEKSHDCFAVPGCHNAHLAFTRANLGKEGYHAAWTEAMERYILWQWVSGKVRLADITQRPKESIMEAPMCKICETRHYVRDPHQFGQKIARPPQSGIERNVRTNSAIKTGNPVIEYGGGRNAGKTDIQREGRRVLKAEAARPDATRTAATARPDPKPAKPGKPAGKKGQRRAAKPSPGKRKPRAGRQKS